MKPKIPAALRTRRTNLADLIRLSFLSTPILLSLAGNALAQALYWDTNGATAGFGTTGGTWDTTTPNWSTSLDGDVATTVWADGSIARFQTPGAYSITLDGTVATPQIRFAAGGVQSLTGGTINISPSSGFTLHSAAAGNPSGNEKTVSSAITGTGPVTLTLNGDLSPNGGASSTFVNLSSTTSDFTGDLTVTSGLLSWSNDAALGNVSNKIILNGGGILDPNLSRTTSRAIEIGASGGTIRTYGSATSTLAGVISGSGSINRTDAGLLVLTNPANTHSGTWNLQGGNLRVSGGGSLGTANINNATSLQFYNDATAATYSNGITGAGSIFFESAAGTTYNGTINTTGILWIGDVTNNAAVTFANGADITVRDLSLGETSGIAGNLTQQAGSSVTVSNDFRVGHWSNHTSVYNMAGGTLDILGTPVVGNTNFETPGVIILGVDGIGIFNQNGGTVTAAGLGLDTRSDTAGTDQYNLNGGTLILGSKGIGGFASSQFNLGGGTLQASSNFPSTKAWNVAADSVVEFDGYQITQSSSITGTSTLTLQDSFLDQTGRFLLNGAAQTISAPLAGSVPIEYTGTGSLTLSGASTYSGDLTVFGGTLNLTGSTAADVVLLNATTLSGEGSTSGDLEFANVSGTNTLSFDPTTPGALQIGGALTTDGTITLALTKALPVTSSPITVATYASVSGTGTFVLPDIASYRSASLNVGATALTLDLTTKELVWSSGTTWDTGTSSVWGDGSETPSSFFWGDHVLFDDTATSTAVTIGGGNIQPARITVNSGTNNFAITGSTGNAITGVSSLLKSGSSTLTLSGPNTFSGGTTISNGTIVFTGTNNNGLGTGAITLGDSNTGTSNVALLLTNAREINNPITIAADGTGTATLGFSGTGANYTAFTGPISINRDLTVRAGTTDRFHFGGNITGSGDVLVEGGQRVTMSGNNTYVGDLFITGAGTVFQTFSATSIPDTAIVDVGTGAALQLNVSDTIGALTGTGILRPIAAKPTLTLGTNNLSGTFAGTWTNAGGDHLNIVKNGTGTQTLSGTITSPGALTVNAGTVVLTTAASFDRTFAAGTALPNRAIQGAGTVRTETGADVTLRRSGDGFTGTLAVAGGTVTFGHPLAAGNAAGSITLQGGTLSFDNSGSYFTPLAGTVLTGGTLNTFVTTRDYGTMHNTAGDVVPGTTTHVYHGRIYLPAGQWSFAKRFDDAASITIGGITILNNAVWNETATGSFTANAAGWFDIDVRVQQGGGGVGPSAGWTKGIGIKQGAPTTNNADYVTFDDAAMSALGARVAYANDITLTRPLTVSAASIIDTSKMVGTPGSTTGDGNGANGDLTLAAALSGSGALTKTGAGSLILTAASNAYTGSLIIDGGLVRLNNNLRAVTDITVNPGGVLETNSVNVFVSGHGTTLADTQAITVNGGTWVMAAGHDARIGNVNLSNGATWTSNRGLAGYDALLANVVSGAATVRVSNTVGNTTPSVMNGTGGLHLQGVQNFNVADVTGTEDADLIVNMILAAQGTIGGPVGGVRKIGAGTMTLTAANTYNGGTSVEAGSYIVNNTTGSGTGTGNVTVESGATLGGTGSISGSVLIKAGATLAPGAPIESLATGPLTLETGATVNVEIDSSGTPAADVINVTGDAVLSGALGVTDIAGSPATLAPGTKLTLLTYTNTLSGEFTGRPEGSEFTLGTNTFVIRYQDANAVTLEVVASAGYDDWKTQITNGLTERNEDADSDGFTNLQEFLFGTNPTANTGSLTTAERSGGDLIIRWRERSEGASYQLLESATLENPWIPSAAPVTTDGAADGDYQPMKATITIGAGKNFFRVEGQED